MSDVQATPASADAPPPAVPPGSRIESLLLGLKLAGDLLSLPFHLLVVLFTLPRDRRRLRDTLASAAVALEGSAAAAPADDP